jgi:hypothetical protein
MSKNQKDSIKVFGEKKVRSVWDVEAEKWYISVVDVIEVLTDSVDAAAYWRKLKQRLKEEGNETVTNCHGLKMQAADGKMRMTITQAIQRIENRKSARQFLAPEHWNGKLNQMI